MSALKIVFIAGDRQIVLYGQGMKQMWQVETHVLERLGDEERLRLETAKFRKYWIDEEGDRVEIMNDIDFDFFLKRNGQRTPKVFFEATYPASNPDQGSAPTGQADGRPLSVHKTVSCDVCNVVPVRGFRYKCLQCPNYDLCMKCESQMMHPDHIMLRLPNADSTYESTCPIRFGNKRRDRKCAAAWAAALSGNEAQPEVKSRHHHHHRRHAASGGGTGIWSNFYDMMQDLAEGGTAPQEPTTSGESPQKQQQKTTASAPSQTAPTAAAQNSQGTSTQTGEEKAAGSSQSKETNTSPDRSSGAQEGRRASTSSVPSFENLQSMIDPHFMKAGIQILNNFSEMFGKILDPVATDTSRPDSASNVINIDLTGNSHSSASTTPRPPTSSGTPNEAAGAQKTPTAASGIVTPMETEASPAPSPSSSMPEVVQASAPNSRGEDNDWTMIDNVANAAAEASTAAANAASAATAAAAVAAASHQLDFAKLSQQLQTHIENEKMSMISQDIPISADSSISIPTPAPASIPTPAPVSIPTPAPVLIPTQAPVLIPTPVSTPNPIPQPEIPTSQSVPSPATAPPAAASTTPPPEPTERRAVAVFHADPRINTAVHAMMSMGFSNEGAMLTQLLESVNGNIPLALDYMTAAQRN